MNLLLTWHSSGWHAAFFSSSRCAFVWPRKHPAVFERRTRETGGAESVSQAALVSANGSTCCQLKAGCVT